MDVVENRIVVTIVGTVQAARVDPLMAYPYATTLSPMPA